MTEKEKAKAGLLYNNNHDPQLIKERTECKKICRKYNFLEIDDFEGREATIRQLFSKIGKDFVMEQPVYCDYGYNIEIGDNFFSNHNLVILDEAKVTIGDYVFIGPDCGIYTAGHPLDVERRNEGLEYAYPITIGHNVWIGGGVKIMPGVTIGDNTVIASGSIVTKSIPSNVLAAGVPCKVIREITEVDIEKYK
ncbi:sugar O-acetyltransferase [Bacillus sp. FJAT-49732]|uniref:Acetyltransferase n=1 Tax=Lederbergia citrisecunda TaxID=2833583 RepID=A0A942YN39_9BACI|nr:sugar O-acetyltransferase [Lederbergia citrisecunda]MBS4201335.1 sugar O-acetyltransferase [Lederbergia citrisecunda]